MAIRSIVAHYVCTVAILLIKVATLQSPQPVHAESATEALSVGIGRKGAAVHRLAGVAIQRPTVAMDASPDHAQWEVRARAQGDDGVYVHLGVA